LQNAALVLEDGTRFAGKIMGSGEETIGWVAPYTSMVGYQEIISDPSNQGMILCMTYPLIGNYGVNSQFNEASRGAVRGLLIRKLCSHPVHWRAESGLQEYMEDEGVSGLQGVDTRALSRHLFLNGTMKGAITSSPESWSQLYRRFNPEFVDGMETIEFMETIEAITDGKDVYWEAQGPRLAVIDLGVRRSLLRNLHRRGFCLKVCSPSSIYQKIREFSPRGIIVAGGGVNPEAIVSHFGNQLKKILGEFPVLGISGGLHVLNILLNKRAANGLRRLKVGHRGDNYPVKEEGSGKVYLTTQNHQYQLPEPEENSSWKVTYRNLHDHTVEGVCHEDLGVEGIQFWPRWSIKETWVEPLRVENYIRSLERRA